MKSKTVTGVFHGFGRQDHMVASWMPMTCGAAAAASCARRSASVSRSASPAAPATAPFTVVDMGGIEFVAEIDEVDVDRIELDMEGLVALDAFPERSFEGSVVRVEAASWQLFPCPLQIQIS